MTSKNSSPSEGDDLGILDEAASLDTTALGVLGQTSQVSVTLPAGADDDDDLVEDVVDGEFTGEILVGELETPRAAVDQDAVEQDAVIGAVDEPAVTADADPLVDAEPIEDAVPIEDADAVVDAEPVEDAAAAAPAPAPAPVAAPDIALVSKRFGEQAGQSSRETADLLTADRLLNPSQLTKPEPEGTWSHLLYTISGRRINIGDGKRARERKALTARIANALNGGARFVPVLSRKGGVGKTTVTALLGMALADAREDRVIAVDANPDRGTLADRIVRSPGGKSVRDLVKIHDEVRGYHDLSAIVARDSTRLDVLASDPDPHIAEAFSDEDYRNVADVAAHYYSLVLTDTGTGIVHSVMGATLDKADQIVIVSGLSVDEARLASETLTWLETNGREEQARGAIIVLNQSTPGSPLVRLNELEAHFKTRAKHVVRMPYDPQIAGGGAIVFANLQPETRQAARELAALLVESLRAKAA
ncbi:MinD/ParA family protein [Microbacterium sp. Bi121]|uniref:MinD/ParA family ATP-binding protein n=1 Tax=Microbacterium sp. Bi121 TaxID=2822348 RepID=UPI001D5CCCD3|nr:MinD/ParA family protein [Microbacterium sp. Bi121]CAH0170084.1 ESX-1 secretion-associated protein EspI [Microbacterium sp. Bi121]